MSADSEAPGPGWRADGLPTLEAQIAATREKIASSAFALQREIARATDWREWVRSKPVTALALAFGLGLWLGRK